MWSFISKPYSFHLQFSRTFFFHTTTTKSFISKPIFWCTTLITLYIQIHAKGRLNKLLLLLLIFWVALAPCMSLHDSLSAKRKFERLLCRTHFLFHFHLPSTIFYKYVKIYVKEEKLNYFTVSMLKEICTFFELPFKWESCRGMGRRQPKKLGAGGGAYLAGLLHVFVYTMW